MLAKTPLHHQMIAWLEQQDPNEEYDWKDRKKCACAKFSKAVFKYEAWENFSEGCRLSEGSEDLHWAVLNNIARGGGIPVNWTYGKLLERLRKETE